MKKIILTILAFSMLSFQSVKSEEFYIEGQVNYTQVDDVDTKTYSGSAGGLTFSNLKGSLDYDSDIGLGFEVGAKNVSDSNLRIGLSYSESKIELKKASGTGTVTDGSTTVNFVSVTKAELASIGLNFDNDVKSYSLNAYYDLETNGTFTPYVGVGLGQVDIENANDKELSKSLYLGGRHSVNDQMYVGLKGAYTIIDGPTDKLGLSYKDITQKNLSLIVGYNF